MGHSHVVSSHGLPISRHYSILVLMLFSLAGEYSMFNVSEMLHPILDAMCFNHLEASHIMSCDS